MVSAMRKLSAEDHKRIADAAAGVAARSQIHFVFAIVPASDRYRLYPVIWAAMLTLMAAALLAAWQPWLPLAEGFLAEAMLFVVLSLVFEWTPIRLALVPKRLKRGQAQRLAHLDFAARILAQPQPRGILFFVSLGERYVEILADRETHAKIGETAWQQIVSNFTVAAKAGRLADSALAGIAACSQHLERHFPKQT
jgi:putative membrane protein